jgi:hypothetical protein
LTVAVGFTVAVAFGVVVAFGVLVTFGVLVGVGVGEGDGFDPIPDVDDGLVVVAGGVVCVCVCGADGSTPP